MPKLNHISVTALKDCRVVTGRKTLTYRKVEGLPNGGMPEGQAEKYENETAITLVAEQSVDLDVTDAQLKAFQAGVDSGDIEVHLHASTQVVTTQMAPSAPKQLEPSKGDKK